MPGEELDAFQPDFVVIWGDDQYENFKEDCVPAFAVLAYDSAEVRPWQHAGGRGANSWDEPEDTAFTIQGHHAGGKSWRAGSCVRGSTSHTPTSRSTARAWVMRS